jgi:hypothetical protein
VHIADNPILTLSKGIVNTQQGIGERMSSLERVQRICGKVNARTVTPVGFGRIFRAPLEEKPHLYRMGSPDLRQVV